MTVFFRECVGTALPDDLPSDRDPGGEHPCRFCVHGYHLLFLWHGFRQPSSGRRGGPTDFAGQGVRQVSGEHFSCVAALDSPPDQIALCASDFEDAGTDLAAAQRVLPAVKSHRDPLSPPPHRSHRARRLNRFPATYSHASTTELVGKRMAIEWRSLVEAALIQAEERFCGISNVPIQCTANYYFSVVAGKVKQVTPWQTGEVLPRI